MDDFVARGGSCGSVGLWRRRRIKHEKGWEDSEFDYTEFDSLGAQARFDVQPGSIQAIAVSDDGARVLAARGTSVLLFDAASKQCVAHFTGHMDTVTALAFSPGPDARLGLSGGGGVDRSVRLWELPLQPDTQLVPLPAAAAAAAASEAVDADSQALVPKPERQPQYTLFERAVWALAFQRDVQAQNENSVAQVGTNYLLRNVSAGVQRFRLGSPAASAVESANDPSSSKLVASLPHVPRLVLLSPLDSDVVFAADSCETMALYSIKTGEVVRNLEAPSALKEEEEEDADGEGEEDGAGSITTSATVSTGESWGPSSLTSGCFTPCGRLLVLAGYNRALMGSFSVWDVRSGRRVAKLRVPRQQVAKERESHRHDSFSYDITLCEHENQNSSSGGGERSYWIAAVAPNDIVTQWRLVVPPTDDFTATPPKIEQMWQQRVDVLSSHATVHGLRYFQSRSSATAASASFAPLLLLADSASVVSIRSSLNGALLHCFSAAASGARTDPSDPGLMGLELLGINQGNAEEDVQLVTVSASEGASVWQVGSLLRQLCSAAAAGQVTPAPSTGAGLVADETGVLRPPLRSLSSPPPLQASLRCTSQMCTRMAVSAEGDHIAIGALDGSVFIFNRAIASNNNSVEAAASAAAPAATKSLPTRPRQWRGLFDFRPAQRAQLNGLVAQLDCLQ
jgi:WD40 repeat protein